MPADTPQQIIDPVCQMRITPAEAVARRHHRGRTYHFCSPGCVKWFDEEPDRYLQPGGPQDAFERHHGVDRSSADDSHPPLH